MSGKGRYSVGKRFMSRGKAFVPSALGGRATLGAVAAMLACSCVLALSACGDSGPDAPDVITSDFGLDSFPTNVELSNLAGKMINESCTFSDQSEDGVNPRSLESIHFQCEDDGSEGFVETYAHDYENWYDMVSCEEYEGIICSIGQNNIGIQSHSDDPVAALSNLKDVQSLVEDYGDQAAPGYLAADDEGAPADSPQSVVICQDAIGGVTLTGEVTGYELDTGQVTFSRTFSSPNQQIFTCDSGWNPDFTQRVAVASVPNNGDLPEVFTENESRIIGETNSTEDFATAEFNAYAPAIDANGDVWWLDDLEGGFRYDVYRNAKRINSFSTGAFVDGFRFKGGQWEIVGTRDALSPASGSFGHGRSNLVEPDPFGLLPETRDLTTLPKPLPESELVLGNAYGWYTPDRSALVFLAERAFSDRSEWSLFMVPDNGGNPTKISDVSVSDNTMQPHIVGFMP